MPKELKNCAGCGKWCEKTDSTGLFSIPFPLQLFGGHALSPAFCCANCRNLYYSARPIRRLTRKMSIVWNTGVVAAFVVVAQFKSKTDPQTTSNISTTKKLSDNREETKAKPVTGEILKWTSNDGKVIEAEFRGLQGDDVLLKVASTGETHIIPLARLSTKSQLQAKAAKR